MSAIPSQPQPSLTSTGEAANGAISGAAALAATQPLFFIKTALQAQSAQAGAARQPVIRSVMQALIGQHFAKIKQTAPIGAPFKGRYVLGAWAGGSANAGSGALAEGLTFGARDASIHAMRANKDALTPKEDIALTGLSSVVGAPINVAAEKVMFRQMQDNGGFIAHTKNVYRTEGLRGFTKGNAVCLVRDALYNTALFPLNDACKRALAQ